VAGTLRILEGLASGQQIALRFELDGARFATSLWYESVDFDRLRDRLGDRAIDRLVVHAALFFGNTLISLRPEALDPGPFAPLVTPGLARLFAAIADNVWAQWRYEHRLPDARGPQLMAAGGELGPLEVPPPRGGAPVLFLCGGGKDSLVASHLLDQAGIAYASLGYSSAVYGEPAHQHALIDRLLDHTRTIARHRIYHLDDFSGLPLPSLLPRHGVRRMLAAETPASLWAALPVVIAHGLRTMVVGHERSANAANLVWEGGQVNHQWGKSLEAEALLDEYVGGLVPGARWVSVLQPVHDLLIFELLGERVEAVGATHSCNVRKPWCCACAKCAYVGLNYLAHLPDGAADALFSDALLDDPRNESSFREMLGLAAHTPFECVGEAGEARLACALAAARGRKGRAIDLFRREVGPVDVSALLARYATVYDRDHRLPDAMARAVLPAMHRASARAQARVRRVLERGG
jgi:hypothetical protein